jgi:hypothetical protein
MRSLTNTAVRAKSSLKKEWQAPKNYTIRVLTFTPDNDGTLNFDPESPEVLIWKCLQSWTRTTNADGEEKSRPVVTAVWEDDESDKPSRTHSRSDLMQILLPSGDRAGAQYDPKERFRALIWDYEDNAVRIWEGPPMDFAPLKQLTDPACDLYEGPVGTFDIVFNTETTGRKYIKKTGLRPRTMKDKSGRRVVRVEPLPDEIIEQITNELPAALREGPFEFKTLEEVAADLFGTLAPIREGGGGTARAKKEPDPFAEDDDGFDE